MLSSRQAERRAPGPEESRRSGSVRRPPEEPAPLHRAGSARLPAGYEAQYDEQSLMNPPLDRHAPPPPAPPSGQYHQQADRRQHQSNGVVRPGPGVQTASPPDSGGAGRQQRPGSRRGLPKSVSGPLSGDYDSLYDSPYDAVYDRPNGYDPPPYVPPAPPPAGADQWRGADWPGRAGGAAYPPSRHDWNRDGRGGSARHRAGSQQDVRSALGASQQDMRSALTASQQDMRSALTASQQDMRSALAASYQAYRRASGALADGGDSERRLQAVLRQYRSQQDLGSAGDSAGRYGPYRHARGLSYGQEMAGAYYQERGGRHGYVPEHRRSYSHLHEREVPAYERRQSVHHFGESCEMERSLPRTHEPRERERSLPRSYEPRERDQSLPRDYHHREPDHSLPRNYEHHHSLPQGYNHEDHHQGQPRPHDPSFQSGRSQEPNYQSIRPHEPPQQYTRPPEHQQYARPPEPSQQYSRPPEASQQYTRPPEPSQPYARPHDPVAEAVVTQPSPLRPLGDPNGRHPPEPSDVGGGPLLHRQGGAFQPYQADHGPGRGGGQDRWRQNGGQDEPVYAAVRKGPSRGAGETLQDRSQQQQQMQQEHQQQQHQQQHQHQHQHQHQQEKDYYDHQQMQQVAQRHQQIQQGQHNSHYYQQQQQEQQQYQHQQNHSQQQNSHHQNHYNQHPHQQQHLPVDGSPYHRPDGEAPSNRPRSPVPPGDRQAAEEHWRTKGPSGPNGPHGNGSVHGPQYFPVQQNGQQSTNESQNRSPPSGNVQTSSFQGNGSDPANQRSPQQPTPQSTQVSTSETAEQLEETPELTARPAPTGAESQQSTGGRTTQEETSAAGTATEAATDGATEPSGVDTRSVGTVGQRVAVWESKGPAPPAPSGQSNGNGSSTGQQRQQTGGAQERPEEDQAEEYQTQEAMGPLYALLARDRGSLEVKTVRTVKRESQQRQREKGRQASLENVPSGGEVPSDGEEEDPLVTDPVLSQFQRALSLPRGYGGRRASEQDNSQQRHHMLKRLVDQRRPAERRPSAYERLFGSTPELRAAAGPAGAAAERQDLSLRRVPRRHHTLSVGSRLAVRRLSDAAAAHGASAEELPTEPRPPLRQASSTPDIVRASRPGLATKYDEDTIDKLLARPQKIRIPERYVPELEVEPMSVEERLQRSRKAASIRKMLTQSTGFLDTIGSQTEPRVRPGVAATDKLQRAHLLQLNEILARQVTEQSKRVAAANSSPE
ncbi:filaggrin-2-like isoform X2 [Amphibalanus amphitrite]|uniref:filaggrin-2-like isoform X2 n=1 Tax=Amphibalanus amphitrite TaxID=1232801 RepID=UPI001C9086C7|nr:filaggrin-2-like isoform X2 [Amphibalanus amphitrite]